QTIWRFVPLPSSTSQTVSRSAFRWLDDARICETITLSMFAPRVSMFLVSIPARVSRSAISSGFFGRSTNSRSQLTENLIFRHSHPERSRGIPWSGLNVMQRDVSTSLDMTTICSRELPQKPQIILREEPDIRNFE